MPSEVIFLEHDPRYDEHNPHLVNPIELARRVAADQKEFADRVSRALEPRRTKPNALPPTPWPPKS